MIYWLCEPLFRYKNHYTQITPPYLVKMIDDIAPLCGITTIWSSHHARSHGGHCPPNCVVPRKICFKHLIMTKILPSRKNAFCLPNLKTWLRVCITYDANRNYSYGNILYWRYLCIVATAPLALRSMCDSPRTGCVRRITPIYSWHEQPTTEWSRRVISTVACCHSVKLCALAARAFRSQQYQSM